MDRPPRKAGAVSPVLGRFVGHSNIPVNLREALYLPMKGQLLGLQADPLRATWLASS